MGSANVMMYLQNWHNGLHIRIREHVRLQVLVCKLHKLTPLYWDSEIGKVVVNKSGHQYKKYAAYAVQFTFLLCMMLETIQNFNTATNSEKYYDIVRTFFLVMFIGASVYIYIPWSDPEGLAALLNGIINKFQELNAVALLNSGIQGNLNWMSRKILSDWRRNHSKRLGKLEKKTVMAMREIRMQMGT
ncbi:unnamed protein product, partial [Orchesella dallaii]